MFGDGNDTWIADSLAVRRVEEIPGHYTPFLTIFVYIMLFLTFFWMLPYCIYATIFLIHFDKEGRFDTISSHCSNPKSKGYSFLLMLTSIAGISLAALNLDEYNSFDKEQIDGLTQAVFWIEFASVLTLPLIGVFHTDGGGVYHYYRFFCYPIPIVISNILHVGATIAFISVSLSTNLFWVVNLDDGMRYRMVMEALCYTTIACVMVFFIFQVLIKGILKRYTDKIHDLHPTVFNIFFTPVPKLEPKAITRATQTDFECQENLEHEICFIDDTEAIEMTEFDIDRQQRQPLTKPWVFLEKFEIFQIKTERPKFAIKWQWRLASFLFETFSVIMIFATQTMESLCRNNQVQFTANCILAANCAFSPSSNGSTEIAVDYCTHVKYYRV